MWVKGGEWQRWVGGTLLTWLLSHVLIYSILPGHQADLIGSTGDGEEELRMRETSAPSQHEDEDGASPEAIQPETFKQLLLSPGGTAALGLLGRLEKSPRLTTSTCSLSGRELDQHSATAARPYQPAAGVPLSCLAPPGAGR